MSGVEIYGSRDAKDRTEDSRRRLRCEEKFDQKEKDRRKKRTEIKGQEGTKNYNAWMSCSDVKRG